MMQTHLTLVRRFCVSNMKKYSYKRTYKKVSSKDLYSSLQEAEREFASSMSVHWDTITTISSMQQSVLKSAYRIKLVRKVLYVLGDIPRIIN